MMDTGDKIMMGFLMLVVVAVVCGIVVLFKTDSSYESGLRCELEGFSRSDIIDKKDAYNKHDDVVLCYNLTGESLVIGE